jgi:hypothetical protein
MELQMQDNIQEELSPANQLDLIKEWFHILFTELLSVFCSKELYVLGIFFGCYVYFVYLDHFPNLILSSNNFDILLILGIYGILFVLALAFSLIFPAITFLNVTPKTKTRISYAIKSHFSRKNNIANTESQTNQIFLLTYIITLMTDFLIYLLLAHFLSSLIDFSFVFVLWISISLLKNISFYWVIEKRPSLNILFALMFITLMSIGLLSATYYPMTKVWYQQQNLILFYVITAALIIFSAVCAKFITDIKQHQINKNTIILIIFIMLSCTIVANKLAHTSLRFTSGILKSCHLGGYFNANIYVTENGTNYFGLNQIVKTDNPKKFEIKNINVVLTSQNIYYINLPNSTVIMNFPEHEFMGFSYDS